VAVLDIADVTKRYGGLRPLRIKQLRINAAERVALVGFERAAAEVFVNLVTGQSLPDTGRIAVFDQNTSAITDSAAWLQLVDRFGIVSPRAVLLEPLSTLQNLAMPFTLSIEPVPDEARSQAEALGCEVGLGAEDLATPVSSLDDTAKLRLRVGRALALRPAVLLLEHVSAGLPSNDAASVGRDIASIAVARGVTLVALTADESFARIVARRVLRWEPASGRLAERRGWFGGRLG
jgi:predicted ABC-type transport system involved in lysophospholipase L1 biosynthesis ATPase subunit